MILCRSQFYKEVPWVRPSDSQQADSFTLELYVWRGDKVTDEPANPQYTKTVTNVEGVSTTLDVEIGKLIQDFIPEEVVNSSSTELLDGLNTVWVKHQVKYLVGQDETTELVETDIATNGYAFGMEGKNYSPANIFLSDVEEIDSFKQSFVQVPILASEVSNIKVSVNSLYDNLLNEDIPATTDSDEIIKVLNIKCKDADENPYITVSVEGVEEYCIFLRDESKHTPVDVQFLNRYGHLQTLTFFSERKDSFETTGQEYERRNGQPSDEVHQFVSFAKNGMDMFSLSTGYLEESVNDLIKQFLLSEFFWISGEPVNLVSTSQTFQTRNNDKLVSYQMEFKKSYRAINSI